MSEKPIVTTASSCSLCMLLSVSREVCVADVEIGACRPPCELASVDFPIWAEIRLEEGQPLYSKNSGGGLEASLCFETAKTSDTEKSESSTRPVGVYLGTAEFLKAFSTWGLI